MKVLFVAMIMYRLEASKEMNMLWLYPSGGREFEAPFDTLCLLEDIFAQEPVQFLLSFIKPFDSNPLRSSNHDHFP